MREATAGRCLRNKTVCGGSSKSEGWEPGGGQLALVRARNIGWTVRSRQWDRGQ
jgi:hypothetical protein